MDDKLACKAAIWLRRRPVPPQAPRYIQGSSPQAPKATLGTVPCACVLVSPLYIIRLYIQIDRQIARYSSPQPVSTVTVNHHIVLLFFYCLLKSPTPTSTSRSLPPRCMLQYTLSSVTFIVRVNPNVSPTRVAAPSPRASVGRRTVFGLYTILLLPIVYGV